MNIKELTKRWRETGSLRAVGREFDIHPDTVGYQIRKFLGDDEYDKQAQKNRCMRWKMIGDEEFVRNKEELDSSRVTFWICPDCWGDEGKQGDYCERCGKYFEKYQRDKI